MNIPLVIAVLIVSGLVITQVMLWRASKRAITAVIATQAGLRTELAALTQQLVLVGQIAVPISVALQTILVKELTHYHTPRIDGLLAKLGPPFTLTEAEEVELVAALKEREKDMGAEITDSEREAAQMLPAIIRRVKREAGSIAPEAVLLFQMVSIVAPTSEEPKVP